MARNIEQQYIIKDRGSSEIDKVAKKINKDLTSVESKSNSVSSNIINHWKAIAAFIGATSIIKDTLETASAFERFEIQLKTITGSSAEAAKSMDWIREFAKTTPYELDKVTDAFTKLKAYGFDAVKYIPLLGDTASSMGKDLIQAVEAFADAATGEFERLKEFGVRASQQGDKVTFSWSQNGQEMVATAEKTQAGITTALGQIFKRFEGGMKQQASTLSGVWSNLKDNITDVQLTFAKAGITDALKDGILEVSKAIKDWTEANKDLIKQKLPEYISNIKDTIVLTYNAIKPLVSGFVELSAAAFRLGESLAKSIKDVDTVDIDKNIEKYKKAIEEINKRIEPLKIDAETSPIAARALEKLESKLKDYTIALELAQKSQTDLLNAKTQKKEDTTKDNSVESFTEVEKTKTDVLSSELEIRTRKEQELYELNQKWAMKELDTKIYQYQQETESTQKYINDQLTMQSEYNKEYVEANSKTMEKVRQANQSVANSVSSNFDNAFWDMIDGSKSVTEAFTNMAKSILKDLASMIIKATIYKAVMSGLEGSSVGGLIGSVASYNGNVFDKGEVKKFATGGVVSQPSTFPMASIAERGQPEAIIPLQRDKSGRLGVAMQGKSAQSQNVNINTVINVSGGSSGNQSEDKRFANDISRALDEKIRNIISTELRPKGMLNPTYNISGGFR